jgi:ABC-type Fe3+/spermidine/putrescine transport system ATPase subunit
MLFISDVTVRYGSVAALKNLSLTVNAGEILAILGPSGSGKSTLLQVLAGLQPVASGEVRTDDRLLSNQDFMVPPEQRGIGMVFQDFALWPHMTVHDTIRFPLDSVSGSRESKAARVNELLGLVQLAGFGGRFPHELSGGQRQRVAIARALAAHPSFVLLDEPMASLDAQLRETMRVDLARILHEQNATALYVTHDRTEAMVVADRVALLHGGVISQIGTPHELYEQPLSRFNAEFLGPVNWIPADVITASPDPEKPAGVQLAGGPHVTAHARSTLSAGQHGSAMVRPEDLEIVSSGTSGHVWHGTVQSAYYLGMHWQVRVAVPELGSLHLYHTRGVKEGQTVQISLRRPAVWLLPDQPAASEAAGRHVAGLGGASR